MFKHIVCPIGREEWTFFAVPAAIDLAKIHNARLTLLHLDDSFLDEDERVMLRVSVKEAKSEFTQRALEDRQIIEAICRKNGWSESIADIELREGVPGPDLAGHAEALGADLLIIHAAGRQTLYEKVVGSVSDSIIHRASMAVLVLRRPE